MPDLASIDNGHGIKLSVYANHFIMVFDLTSAQQASHEFIHLELTNCSISNCSEKNLDFIIGEKVRTVFIDSTPKVSKNHFMKN